MLTILLRQATRGLVLVRLSHSMYRKSRKLSAALARPRRRRMPVTRNRKRRHVHRGR
jgi:hypothetical protein